MISKCCIVGFDASSYNDNFWMCHSCEHSGHLTSDTMKFSPSSTWHNFSASRHYWEKNQGRMLNIMLFHNRDTNKDFTMADSSPFQNLHDDVIKWQHFPCCWPFVRGVHRSPVNSPHKGQWRGALMFFVICVWINGWENNRKNGDLRHYRAHYDVIVMKWLKISRNRCLMS